MLKRAGDARDKTAIKSLKEETQTVMLARQINTSTGVENKNLKDDIEKGISGAIVEEIEGYKDVYYVKKGNNYVTIYEDGDIQEGKAEIWDGKKVSSPEFKKENEIWNWYIYTPSQFKFLADFVNNGNSLTGTVDLTSYVTEAGYNPDDVSIKKFQTKVYLMNSIDMGARQSDGDTIEQKWETDANKKVKWTPIGSEFSNNETSKAFIGTFNGNNYNIRGVYANESSSENIGCGIFSGYTIGVKNLIVKNSYIKGKKNAGGIAVVSCYGIKNCKNIDSFVVATNGSAGGIVAVSWNDLINCDNYGNVIGNNEAGGIVGQLNSSSMNVRNCKNFGNVISVKANESHAGGIAGSIFGKQPTITGCTNEGKIEGFECTGGIVGWAMDNATPIITDCKNNAEIKGNGQNIGGILGYITASGTLTGCTNNGNIFGKQNVDGIVGNGKSLCTITNCVNNGKINIVN